MIEGALSSGEWVQLQDLYCEVKQRIDFDDADMLPEVEGSSQEAWKRNVRNVLQRRKGTGDVLWRRGAFYSLRAAPSEHPHAGSLRLPRLTSAQLAQLEAKRRATGERGEEWVVQGRFALLLALTRPGV